MVQTDALLTQNATDSESALNTNGAKERLVLSELTMESIVKFMLIQPQFTMRQNQFIKRQHQFIKRKNQFTLHH